MNSKFHERFDIPVQIEEAKRHFINRASSLIFGRFLWEFPDSVRERIPRAVVAELGDEYEYRKPLPRYFGNDFYKCLHAVEAFYFVIPYKKRELDRLIQYLLRRSDVDLGVNWREGRFHKSGAEFLDDKLVKKPLHWLRDKKYENVQQPFEKGLDHFLHSVSKPELLSDVITDMYEALEALAKIVTKRPTKELSAIQQLFLREVRASEEYKKILAEYISYAQNFRHAVKEGAKRPQLSPKEVESFIYLTGLFIRLAMP